MKGKITKILTGLLTALGIYLLIAGIKAETGIVKTYDGKIPIWLCVLPYVIGLFLVILTIITINKDLSKKTGTLMLAVLAVFIFISGIAEIFNIPEDYSSGDKAFYIVPYIIELLITIFAAVSIRKKQSAAF